MVLQALVSQAHYVLMNLRGYAKDRQWRRYELGVQASRQHIEKLVIVYDQNTDQAGAE